MYNRKAYSTSMLLLLITTLVKLQKGTCPSIDVLPRVLGANPHEGDAEGSSLKMKGKLHKKQAQQYMHQALKNGKS